jgi:hypothetical protein
MKWTGAPPGIIVHVTGDVGIGKSRLANEFMNIVAGESVELPQMIMVLGEGKDNDKFCFNPFIPIALNLVRVAPPFFLLPIFHLDCSTSVLMRLLFVCLFLFLFLCCFFFFFFLECSVCSQISLLVEMANMNEIRDHVITQSAETPANSEPATKNGVDLVVEISNAEAGETSLKGSDANTPDRFRAQSQRWEEFHRRQLDANDTKRVLRATPRVSAPGAAAAPDVAFHLLR